MICIFVSSPICHRHHHHHRITSFVFIQCLMRIFYEYLFICCCVFFSTSSSLNSSKCFHFITMYLSIQCSDSVSHINKVWCCFFSGMYETLQLQESYYCHYCCYYSCGCNCRASFFVYSWLKVLHQFDLVTTLVCTM